jgi:hypothetical protein
MRFIIYTFDTQITFHISRHDAKHVISIFSQQFVSALIATVTRSQNLIKSCKKKKIAASKKLIIVMFSKKRKIKILKTKRLFLFIIACYSRNLNTIQSFREVKKRNRLTLKDFHHTFQDVIAARQKNLELDFYYNSLSFKLSSTIISNQFFRKSILDSFNDIDLFDLKFVHSLRSTNTSRLSSSYQNKSSIRRKFSRFVIMKENIKMIFLFEITRLKFFSNIKHDKSRCEISWFSWIFDTTSKSTSFQAQQFWSSKSRSKKFSTFSSYHQHQRKSENSKSIISKR